MSGDVVTNHGNDIVLPSSSTEPRHTLIALDSWDADIAKLPGRENEESDYDGMPPLLSSAHSTGRAIVTDWLSRFVDTLEERHVLAMAQIVRDYRDRDDGNNKQALTDQLFRYWQQEVKSQ